MDPSVLGGSVLFRTWDRITIQPGTTQKVHVYYPNTSMDPARFQYFVESTDQWGQLSGSRPTRGVRGAGWSTPPARPSTRLWRHAGCLSGKQYPG